MHIRMSGKSINLDDKKIKKQRAFQIDEVDDNKILVSKKNHMAQRVHLNTLSNIMIMMLLDHYV